MSSTARPLDLVQNKQAFLARLREHPAFRNRPLPRRATISSGFASLDALLSGGFVGGELGALVGPAGCTSLALGIAARATARGEVVAWIDPDNRLDPLGITAAGGHPERFLWIRPTGARAHQQALHAAEQILDAGGFALVILDGLQEITTRPAWWIRLQRRLAGTPTTCIVIGAAGWRTDWRLQCRRQTSALDGPLRVTVERRRGGAPGPSATIQLATPVD